MELASVPLISYPNKANFAPKKYVIKYIYYFTT